MILNILHTMTNIRIFPNIDSGFNDPVEIYPLYEPVNAAEKITNLGNLTLYGNPEGLNVSLTIHAVRGGHVTVYFNATTPAIK